MPRGPLGRAAVFRWQNLPLVVPQEGCTHAATGLESYGLTVPVAERKEAAPHAADKPRAPRKEKIRYSPFRLGLCSFSV